MKKGNAGPDSLFEPVKLGRFSLPNRLVMAPLTRCRSQQPGNVPTALNADYYAQRAPHAGLIISEATQISQEAQGYAWTPGIHTEAQIEGWRLVTDAVHSGGGRIFLQLWHVGRISHPVFQPDGGPPVAPSAIRPDGQAFVPGEDGKGAQVPFVTPRGLETDEVERVVDDYRHAAANARRAGFDGVEIHGANGYLIHQFICSATNRRADRYGGPVENRARFLSEVVEAVCGIWSCDRVGLRLSPLMVGKDMQDEDPEGTYRWIAEELNHFDLAYLHITRQTAPDDEGVERVTERSEAMSAIIRDAWKGALLICGGFSPEEAATWLSEDRMDAAVFGRLYISNPDLDERIRQGAALTAPDPETFYGGGEAGYTDYPFLSRE
ncbi:MAG: alkene reductase [Gammaproteobacteria bacterium]|jgi:N-ethylmaleimide reductase